MGFLTLISAFFAGKQIIKESSAPVLPPIENMDAYRKDILNGAKPEELRRNQMNNKYARPANWERPRTNEAGQMVVENMELWREDKAKYGSVQAHKWLRQGRYNMK